MFVLSGNGVPMLTLAGEVSVVSPNKHFKRKPVEYIIYIVKEGHMRLIEGNVLYDLKKNDVILLDPTRTHYGVETFSDVKYDYLHFVCDCIQEMELEEDALNAKMIENRLRKTQEDLIIPKYIHLLTYDANRVRALSESIKNEYREKQSYYKRRVNAILLDIIACVARAAVGDKADGKSGRSDITGAVMDYIYESFHGKISGKDLEKALHMNFDYMNRCFKKQTGYTIMVYANHIRVGEAKNLLRSGTYNVSQAATETGFANEFYFSRIFKKYEGISPSEYLKSVRNNSF